MKLVILSPHPDLASHWKAKAGRGGVGLVEAFAILCTSMLVYYLKDFFIESDMSLQQQRRAGDLQSLP